MNVQIKALDGRRVKLSGLQSHTTVKEMKEMIQDELGLDASVQRLVMTGGELSDGDQPLLAPGPDGPPTILHLVPSRASLRRPGRRSSSASSSTSSLVCGRAAPVIIPRLDFGLISVHGSIGTGSFKSVFKGSYGSHRIACLRFRGGEAATKDALKEAEIMARLPRHASVLRFFGMSHDHDGCYHLVCEFAELGALDAAIDALPGRRPPWPLVCAIGSQVAAGMSAVVAMRLLHRDLSLRNVLCFKLDVSKMEVLVKVGDFGKALTLGATPPLGESIPLRWSAPEVVTEQTYSEASDVWSYGVTIWELASAGAVPFAQDSDTTVLQTIMAAKDSGYLLPRPFNCPAAIAGIMHSCWRTDPRMRPQFNELEVMMERAVDKVREPELHCRRSDPLVDPIARSIVQPTESSVRCDPLVGVMQQPPPYTPMARTDPHVGGDPLVSAPHPTAPSMDASAAMVTKLAEMGFDACAAQRALADSHNNLQLATTMLLSACT
eukprot:m.235012 g.235012  ORF g.235012 m.235012 type:complete len:493 (-) comp26139_c0_seq1:4605-6083(-)